MTAENESVDTNGFHEALLEELHNTNLISQRALPEGDWEDWADEMPVDDLMLLAERAMRRASEPKMGRFTLVEVAQDDAVIQIPTREEAAEPEEAL